MEDRVLLAALLKLHANHVVAASQFTERQRIALNSFGRQTGAIQIQRQGRGDVFKVLNPALFTTHLQALSPGVMVPDDKHLPARAQHIANARDSKAGAHRHTHCYVLLKAIGQGVVWQEADRSIKLPLSEATADFGVASIAIAENDAWSTSYPLWLIENQALFDRTDWLLPDTKATLLYYGGHVHGQLLEWLKARQRAQKIIHFADYDGVGLANFVRLNAALGDHCSFWLMPDWSDKLNKYGNSQLWRDTLREFNYSNRQLPKHIEPLVQQMLASGMALEQEAVWL